MRIRRISYARYRRNIPFCERQAKGEEIHLTQLGNIVGILFGEPFPEEPQVGSMPGRGKVIWRTPHITSSSSNQNVALTRSRAP
ncbi:MAG: hypothetical protein HY017_17975 [Betaproteobacteria bacterium]|nr:hypothetical protein [Betaproteobacteria bacterium]